MENVNLTITLGYNDEKNTYKTKAEYYFDRKQLVYNDHNAKMSLFLNQKLLIRKTVDYTLIYDFYKIKKLKVYVNELKSLTMLELNVKHIEINDSFFLVIYHIEGNDFDHEYKIEWRT